MFVRIAKQDLQQKREIIKMKYKEALNIFENEKWTEEESALFYYRWFNEEFLFDMFKEGREQNPKEFIRLVKEIKKNDRI